MSDSHQNRFQHLSPEEASALLRKRLTTFGVILGILMSILWVLISSLLLSTFPRFGSPAFLLFLVVSMLILALLGAWAGRRVWKRTISKP